MREIAPAVAVVEIRTLTELVDESLATERLIAYLSSAFGVLALALACLGLYGVMSYVVAGRTNEIGIRMALGAERRDLLGLVLRETFLRAGAGVALGLPAVVGAGRLLGSQLYGLTASDPVSISLATLLLLGVAVLAGYVPARRACRVDPMTALRGE